MSPARRSCRCGRPAAGRPRLRPISHRHATVPRSARLHNTVRASASSVHEAKLPRTWPSNARLCIYRGADRSLEAPCVAAGLRSETAHLRPDALAPSPHVGKPQPVVPVPLRPLVPALRGRLLMHTQAQTGPARRSSGHAELSSLHYRGRLGFKEVKACLLDRGPHGVSVTVQTGAAMQTEGARAFTPARASMWRPIEHAHVAA